MRKLIFSIIALLGLSATAELSAQFLSADLQADDLRGNVAKVEYEYEGISTYEVCIRAFYYDNNGRLYLDSYADPKITRTNNKITEIEVYGEETASYAYNGNHISKIKYDNAHALDESNLFYNQNGNLIRKETTTWGWNGDTGREDVYKTIYQYTILERDSKGNWIKRSVKSTNKWGTETHIQTRKITYR